MNIEGFNPYSGKIPPLGEASKIFPKQRDQKEKERQRRQPPKSPKEDKVSSQPVDEIPEKGKNIDTYR